MPTYEYACKACGHRLEAVQSFSDDPLTRVSRVRQPRCARSTAPSASCSRAAGSTRPTRGPASGSNGSGKKGADASSGETSATESSSKKESASDKGGSDKGGSDKGGSDKSGSDKGSSDKGGSRKDTTPASSTAG